MAATRKIRDRNIDWEAIERDYRAGLLSLREIGRQYNVTEAAIRQKAAKNQWQRDLTAEVRTRAASLLLRSPEDREVKDEEAIDRNARLWCEVVRGHQHRIGRLQGLADSLIGTIEAEISKRPLATPFPVKTKDSYVDSLVKLSRVVGDVIPLERQAYGIDENSGGEDLASWLKAQVDLD